MNARELLIAETLEWSLNVIQTHFDISTESRVIAARAALEDLHKEREEFEAWASEGDFTDPFEDSPTGCGLGHQPGCGCC